jgi:hypothetical protein
MLTAGMVAGAYQLSPPKYQTAALVLMLPSRSEVGRGGNPFLQLSGLEQPAGILAAVFSSTTSQAEVLRVSPTAEYEVALDATVRGPVITVSVTDDSPDAAQKTLDYLLDRIPQELARLQQQVNARGGAVLSSMPLTVDREPKAETRGTIRLMVLALVAGLVGTGVASVAADGLVERRKPRGARRSMRDAASHERPSAAEVSYPAASWHAEEERSPAGRAVLDLEKSPALADQPDGARKTTESVPATAWSWGGPES